MNTKDIAHLAQLSRLHLEESEIEEYTKQFDEIVAYVDKIKEVSIDKDIDEKENITHSKENGTINVLREDVVVSYSNPEKIIDEAPVRQDNFVQVKRILKQE